MILGFLMVVVHFLSEELEKYLSGYKEQILSFSSGASITYIFVQLLPEFQRIASESSDMIFFYPLAGFSSIHLMEKYIAKADLPKEQRRNDYGEIHSVFLFFYHGAIGYLMASVIAESTVSGLLFFLPVILHVAVSSFSIRELHESFFRKKSVKISVSLAPLIGVIAHTLGTISDAQFHSIFGIVIGMFFYVVIKDSIPQDDRGQPKEYMAGVLIYLAAIFASQLV